MTGVEELSGHGLPHVADAEIPYPHGRMPPMRKLLQVNATPHR